LDTLFIMLKNVIIFVLLAVPGWLMVKGKMLSSKDSGTLSKLLTNVGMPFLILSSTLKLQFSGEFTRSMIIAAAIGIVITVLMFLVSPVFVSGDSDSKRRAMMRFCMVFANNGFIGIPLARAVFGDASPVMAYLIILNIITNVLMFTFGVYLISGDKKSVSVGKAIFNPVLIAFIIGIALNLSGVNSVLPELQTYSTYFSNIVTPLSMVILGIKLADVKLTRLFFSWRMYYVSLVRLFVFPSLAVALMIVLRFIPQLSVNSDMIIAFFVALAMPTAGLASAFSDRYSGDTENAVIFTLGTTVLSIVTIPVLYFLLRLIV